jgi:hypothetical protein
MVSTATDKPHTLLTHKAANALTCVPQRFETGFLPDGSFRQVKRSFGAEDGVRKSPSTEISSIIPAKNKAP